MTKYHDITVTFASFSLVAVIYGALASGLLLICGIIGLLMVPRLWIDADRAEISERRTRSWRRGGR